MSLLDMLNTYFSQMMTGGGNPIDIIWCTLRYGASPNNYREFGFAELTSAQRSTYVTNRLSRKLINHYNDPNYIEIFEDKTLFAERFAEWFGRCWISTEGMTKEDLLSFVRNTGGNFIYKPSGNAQGQGIKVYQDVSIDGVDELWCEFIEMPKAILEEWITQHPSLSSIYPDAVNCLRIITVFKDGRTHFLTGGITWGNGMKIANASASGIVSPVNFETGICEKPAADFNGKVYEKHPLTGAVLVGFEVPFWNEVLQMLRNATKVVPQVGYIGWDVAITPERPILIEGNTTPGYKYYQIPAHMTDKIGNRIVYDKFL